ncbi:glycosyltransferase family 9 protein [Acidisphaera rubrifaciens]|uniref:Heptosyltransferase n=1 Tax=Acidisphaera rubrifaciens HS-AP3 TaxID=1231350 RepID=A0A0D6P2B4_9PROT|nr:glycosyltransferase family 9 protein [Acidisphaera rubrifaciens]GAN75900.1 heptosyltransferase [Acidisphaera rubrifaciens HS-AP3]
MARIAILKPDHFGDLILAAPAIRAIASQNHDVTLYVAPGSAGLARVLFPRVGEIRRVTLPHLARSGQPTEGDVPDLGRALDSHDLLIALRNDPPLRALLNQVATDHILVDDDHLVHETALHRRALRPLLGHYSRTALFTGAALSWPDRLRHVGLCIAAGFPTNRWPITYWAELARRLAAEGVALTLIGGPRERTELLLLSRLISRIPHRVLRGDGDIPAFLDALDPVDLVIASDGGTAHLCALRKPVCSVFGSSPWRRYAPFGRHNVVMTRDEPCAPCVQFSRVQINGCLSRECTTLLPAAAVAVYALSGDRTRCQAAGVRVEPGVSHRFAGNDGRPPAARPAMRAMHPV